MRKLLISIALSALVLAGGMASPTQLSQQASASRSCPDENGNGVNDRAEGLIDRIWTNDFERADRHSDQARKLVANAELRVYHLMDQYLCK